MTNRRPAVLALGLSMMLSAASGMTHGQDSFGGGPPARQHNPLPPANGPAPAQRGDTSQAERQDLGVAPTAQLHTGAMHGPTPASIPGGQVITTQGVKALMDGKQAPFLVLDVLGGPQRLPGAQSAAPASQAGSFNDGVQQQFGQYLQQATGGNKEVALVLYCQSRECWMSYNAALRAINLGYRNVLWYRGGIEAWQAAGHPLQQAGMGGPQR